MNIAGVGSVVDTGVKYGLVGRHCKSNNGSLPQVKERDDSRLAALDHEIRGLKRQMIVEINASWKRVGDGCVGPSVSTIMAEYKRNVVGKVQDAITTVKIEIQEALKVAEQERQEKLKERQEKLKERQEKQEAIQRVHQEQERAHQERERADALQRQLDELLGAGIVGKKRAGSEMDGSGEK